MKKLRELIRLKFDAKLTHRQIGAALNISASTVSAYARAAMAAKLLWPLPDELDDDALTQVLEPHAKQLRQGTAAFTEPDWQITHQELYVLRSYDYFLGKTHINQILNKPYKTLKKTLSS